MVGPEVHDDSADRARLVRWATIGLGSALVVVAVVALFRLEQSGRFIDAQTVRAWALRSARLDVSSYTGGANQRGPLWVAFFLVALRISQGPGFWFALAALSIAVAAVTALAVGRMVTRRTGVAAAGWAVAVALGIYLVLGAEEFSMMLFSRNVSAMFTAVGAALLWRAQSAQDLRTRLVTLAGSGVLVGLAVQTMPTTALTAAVFGLGVLLAGYQRDRSPGGAIVDGAAWGVAAAAAIATAPIYYLARGDLSNFIDLYWRYNKIYTSATELTMQSQVREAGRIFGFYYADHTVYAAAIAGFVGLLWFGRRRALGSERTFDLVVLGWWVAEMASVALSQRYFGHYFVLPLIPVAVMGGRVLGALLTARPRPIHVFAPLLALAAVVYGPALRPSIDGYRRAAAFRGMADHEDKVFVAMQPDRRAQRAMLDVISTPDDHLQAWSHWTGFYDELDRPPASRFNAVSWFIGHVYGRAFPDPKFILPGTFEKWQEDVERTPARLFLISLGPPAFAAPVPEPAPALSAYLAKNNTEFFAGFGTLFVANDIPERLTSLFADTGGTPVALERDPAGQLTGGGTGTPTEPARTGELAAPVDAHCYLLSATFTRDATPDATLAVSWRGREDDAVTRVAIAEAHSRSERLLPAGAVTEADAPLGPRTGRTAERVDVLVVGRAAVVFLDGKPVGAMRTTASKPRLTLSSTNGNIVVDGVRARTLTERDWAPCGNTN